MQDSGGQTYLKTDSNTAIEDSTGQAKMKDSCGRHATVIQK